MVCMYEGPSLRTAVWADGDERGNGRRCGLLVPTVPVARCSEGLMYVQDPSQDLLRVARRPREPM